MKFASFTWKALIRRRPVEASSVENESSETNLKRHLTATDLIFYGVGCSVGAGIYSLVGIGARTAGPSIALSFALAGIACCFTSLAYSEFAARVQTAGSAYTFVYVAFGELSGWLVGWNLTLGYAVSAAVVARSWAEYLVGFLSGYGVANMQWLTKFPVPLVADEYTCCPLAIAIIALCTLVLITGVKESARFNTIMTLVNLSVLCFTLLAGIGVVNSGNLFPVFPHGITGMAQGAGLVFFAYLGFDMVSCLSEEVVEPERNMPIGIIGSLAVSMSMYFAIAVVAVGMAPASLLGEDIPIVNALLANACCDHHEQLLTGATETCLSYGCQPVLHSLLLIGSRMVSFGAVFGLTTATFTCLMGQMSKDGLFFKIYSQVNPKTGVPTIGTIITGVFTACVACLLDLESLANAISLGTLMVFTFVDAGVILLRLEQSNVLGSDAPLPPHPPPVTGPDAAVMARTLGLVDMTSEEIRSSVRSNMHSDVSIVGSDGNAPTSVWLLLSFTTSAVVASATFARDWPGWVVLLCTLVLVYCTIRLFLLPQYPPPETFACPMVPIVPLCGIACNSYMMGSMSSETWSLIGVWLVMGMLFYFGYGIHHSELRFPHDEPDLVESSQRLVASEGHVDYRSVSTRS